MSLLFHPAALLLLVACLWLLRTRPRGRVLATLFVGFEIAAIGIAFVVGNGRFDALRLVVLAVVVYGSVFLGAGAWIVRRRCGRALGAAAAALLLGLSGIYAHWIEPYRLEVSRLSVTSAKIERPVRVLVLADLQTDRFGDYERQVFDVAMAQDADLILLPGDYIQIARRRRATLRARLREHLRAIGFGAPLGTIAVRGDVDPDDWPETFAGLDVTTLEHTRTLALPGLTVTALTPRDSRRRRLELPATETFHIVFGHAPDYALGARGGDLLIAGHTHGGQVRLPFLGPILKLSRVPRSWAAGATDLGDGRTLVVSRGVGMERGRAPRIRFLCRPEIVVVDLLPGSL